MKIQQLLFALMVVALGFCNNALAKSEEGTNIRGGSETWRGKVVYVNKGATASDHNHQDIEVVKKEIEWSRNEMQRYKTLRGDWPVRESDNNNSLIRKKEGPQTGSSYWDLIISVL